MADDADDGRLMALARLYRNFFGRQLFLQRAHFFKQLVRSLRFFGVYYADRETHVHHHVVPDNCFGYEVEPHLPDDAAKLHAAYNPATTLLTVEIFPGIARHITSLS